MPKSMFAPILVRFSKQTARSQAELILNTVSDFNKHGYKHVGITYSSNNEQSQKITKTYADKKWKTEINGSNQAQVIANIELLLETPEYQHLKNVFRILPITTCALPGGIGTVKQEWLERDFKYIETFIAKKSHVVLGWQNEAANNWRPKKYAIGGGVSSQLDALVPGSQQTQEDFIQQKLMDISEKYPSNVTIAAEKKTPTNFFTHHRGKIIGGLLGGIIVGAACAIPIALFFAGVFLVPLSLVGLGIVIGCAGLAVAGFMFGGFAGAFIGNMFDKQPSTPQIPMMKKSTSALLLNTMPLGKPLSRSANDELRSSATRTPSGQMPDQLVTSTPSNAPSNEADNKIRLFI